MSKWAHSLLSVGALALAVVLLYLSLRGVAWKAVWLTLASIRMAPAAMAVGVGLVPMFLRAARWRVLLEARAPVSFQTAFWAVAAGYFGNNFLPARGGEFVRSHIVQARSGLGMSYTLATALSERATDAVVLVAIGAFVLPARLHALRASFFVIGGIGLAGLIGLPLLEKPITRSLRHWPKLLGIMRQILAGVGSLHSGERVARFAGFTVAIWFLDAVATSLLASAISIAMPLSLSMLLIVCLSLASALPSTPGYVGIYQFVAVTVLTPFGISAPAAIGFILLTQALNYAVTGILGVIAITRYMPVSWRAFRYRYQPIQIQN